MKNCFCENSKKKLGVGEGSGLGGQGGCERRIEVFVKIQNKNFWGGGGGGGSVGGSGSGWGGQSGCERRIEIFVKISGGGGGRWGGRGQVGGVRVDVNEELKFL